MAANDAAASAGMAGVLVRLEVRLPCGLRQTRAELSEGRWDSEPPAEVGAHCKAVWVARAEGVFGQCGVKGLVAYTCEWEGREATLQVCFQRQLLSPCHFRCTVKEAKHSGNEFLVVRTEVDEAGPSPTGAIALVVELREHLTSHVALRKSMHAPSPASAGFRGSQLAYLLKQATRSALVRIVNLTRCELMLHAGDTDTEDGTSWDSQGFWIVRPTTCVGPFRFYDFGIAGTGLLMSTWGEVSYTIKPPDGGDDDQLHISWHSPWVGKRFLRARTKGGRFKVDAHTEDNGNLTSSVHISDPSCPPVLEVLDAVAFATQTAGCSARSGADLTQLVKQHSVSKYKLQIPSVRALFNQEKATSFQGFGTLASQDAFSSFQISYRIGPEVFRKTYLPNDRVQLSSALPGGDDETETVLASVEAAGATTQAVSWPKLDPMERVLRCQQLLVEALSPIICRALAAAFGPSWPRERGLAMSHLWPVKDPPGRYGAAEVLELDAEGLLQMLRCEWVHICNLAAAPAGKEQLSPQRLLAPLEELVGRWASQAEISEGALHAAEVAAAALLRMFGAEAQAAEMEALRPAPVAPATLSPSLAAAVPHAAQSRGKKQKRRHTLW